MRVDPLQKGRHDCIAILWRQAVWRTLDVALRVLMRHFLVVLVAICFADMANGQSEGAAWV